MVNELDMQCKICGSPSRFIFTKTVLSKYNVSYFLCQNCGFIQTEKPYWLEETYQSALYAFDTGLIARPLAFGRVTEKLIMQYFNPTRRFVDYGGANGVFVRLMRDKGFDFYRHDKYAKNIYALFFDMADLAPRERSFELLTSFEVLEHFENPMEDLSELFSLVKNVLCSTFLIPRVNASELKDWWYFAELHGQHISFYTDKAMKVIAERFGCYYYSNNVDLHLFTPKKVNNFSFYSSYSNSILYRLQYLFLTSLHKFNMKFHKQDTFSHPKSLMIKDADWVKEQLTRGNLPK